MFDGREKRAISIALINGVGEYSCPAFNRDELTHDI